MKREVLCKKCESDVKKLFPVESPYPGEHVKFVDGKAKFDMVCDSCGKSVSQGEYACAFSLWADYGGIPYSEWEGEYLDVRDLISIQDFVDCMDFIWKNAKGDV